ncbi:PAP-associated domain-containing protein 5-like [Achlya hypogyna]|uniref:PAP-associated domain-containing protein 5-like n=1 Tax=Achlya hypogyna TaxID=1202772 RepID=A0A1V9Z488_ACHHY|nr:PAP-associated domain-containing protein 5-like [Achlya hypogyna]
MSTTFGRPHAALVLSPALATSAGALTLQVFYHAKRHPYVEEAAHLEAVWSWFEGLAYEDQRNVLAFVDAPWIANLRAMHAMALDRKHEEGVFVLVHEGLKRSRKPKRSPKAPTPLAERCVFLTWAEVHDRLDPDFVSASRQLLASVRLWDHDSYADGCWIKRSGCIRKGSFQRMLELVLQHGYRSLPASPENELVDVLNLAAFVGLRVIDHLVDQFRGTAARSVALSTRFTRLVWLWEATSENEQHALLSERGKDRIQRVLNAHDPPPNETLLTLAASQLLLELDNNVLNDALYVAETLYSSTLSRCGTCVDYIAREVGKDLQVRALFWRFWLKFKKAAYTERKTASLLPKEPKPKSRRHKKKLLLVPPKSPTTTNQDDGGDALSASGSSLGSASTLNASSPAFDFAGHPSDVASSCSGHCQVHQLPSDEPEFLTMADPLPAAVLRSEASMRETFSLALHHDILDMYTHIQDIVARRRPWQICVVTHLKECVTRLWPDAQVNVFGSFATGLGCPKSDVDLLITDVPRERCRVSHVELLASLLRHEPWVQAIQVIERTTIPLVKVTTAAVPTSCGGAQGVIQLDISFDQPQHRGVETCVFVQRLVAVLPELPPLMLVLKQLLLEHGLNDSYTGGLSSYGLTIMLASVLNPLQLVAPAHRPNLGELFLHFLHLFGCDFDPAVSFVRSTHDGPFGALDDRGFSGCKSLGDVVVIEDPLRPEHNVAKTCFGFAQVQSTFRDALTRVEALYPTFAAVVATDASGFATPDHDLHMWASYQHDSILGHAFRAGHHLHIVHDLRQIWCPVSIDDDDNQFDESDEAGAESIDEWASDAAALLHELATTVCVVCQGDGNQHDAACPLDALLRRHGQLPQ